MASDREQLGDEQYVRSRWANIVHNGSIGIGLIDAGQSWGSWKYAADYTEQREQQIKEKREEIEYVRNMLMCGLNDALLKRILATLEAQLAELQKGWKG